MNLLIQEFTLLILLTLAKQIGLDEARLQQQRHFRLHDKSVTGTFGTARRIRIGLSKCVWGTRPKVNVCLLSYKRWPFEVI